MVNEWPAGVVIDFVTTVVSTVFDETLGFAGKLGGVMTSDSCGRVAFATGVGRLFDAVTTGIVAILVTRWGIAILKTQAIAKTTAIAMTTFFFIFKRYHGPIAPQPRNH